MNRKRILYYVLAFFVFLFLNGLIRRLSPYEEWKDGNLLVNSVIALLFTGIVVLIDSGVRYWKLRHKNA